jgi:hypothetical protein
MSQERSVCLHHNDNWRQLMSLHWNQLAKN